MTKPTQHANHTKISRSRANDCTVSIGGKPWKFRISKLEASTLGLCDVEFRTIDVSSDVPKDGFRAIVLHELLHAIYPFLDEEYIDKGSSDLDGALTEIGL